MKYPAHFNYKAPHINLPFSKPIVIYSYYTVNSETCDLRKHATCNKCGKQIQIIHGNDINYSYTFGLTFHLQHHHREWEEYLDHLAKNMIPDDKTKYEHFVKMSSCKILPKDLSNKRFDECQLTWALNQNYCNPARVPYRFRDRMFLQNAMHTIADGQNAQMFEYIFDFSNKNLSLFDLMGTNHPNAFLQVNYKKAKCLVDNIGNLTLDLQKLICPNTCFHDPELYDNCPNNHTGDIATFADTSYQETFGNLIEELEKYPEFLKHKAFNHELLKSVPIVEHNRVAVVEMNRLLKILISMIKLRRGNFIQKTEEIKLGSNADNNLIRPPLAINMWGPQYSDVDVPEELDNSKRYPNALFSTFRHVNVEDCPAHKDKSKAIHKAPYIEDGKV